MEELRHENRELLRVMEELVARQEDLARLNAELEHTNRGVVALYAEIDEKAEKLRRADQMKSRFLSHMSHEFRTPLTSIMALSRLLTDEVDGKLSPEQHKQAMFIRKSAESLLEMVNELLDLARIEAGKGVVRPTRFTVTELFAALQGVLKPLRGVLHPSTGPTDVDLILDGSARHSGALHRRNEGGADPAQFRVECFEVHRARKDPGGRGTGIQRGKIGECFPCPIRESESRPEISMQSFRSSRRSRRQLQQKVAGTGLGLPLAKGLAELLGGSVR